MCLHSKLPCLGLDRQQAATDVAVGEAQSCCSSQQGPSLPKRLHIQQGDHHSCMHSMQAWHVFAGTVWCLSSCQAVPAVNCVLFPAVPPCCPAAVDTDCLEGAHHIHTAP